MDWFNANFPDPCDFGSGVDNFGCPGGLGEAWLKIGERELGILNYEKSLGLNPQNENAITILEKIRAELDK